MAIAHFCDHCGAENAPGDIVCCACQQPLHDTHKLEERASLLNERYEILSEIGAGGFGAVYKAQDVQKDKRLVAIKQINLKGLSSQEIIEATDSFNREAEILSALSHPLLPTIYDRFSDPEHWYLVMTYIDGLTLDEYLQQQKVKSLLASAGLPLGETLEIALQVCDALHYLHSQQPPVIFRDLKPGNIMRTRKGQLYLIDFGIARRFKPGQLKDTIPFGSPGFAAPEQYGRAQTTPQADIYSLGALLYCLITGDDPSEHPFDFPSLHHSASEGIHELNALIKHMVTLDPIRRSTNIEQVQIVLQHIQQLNVKANQQGRIWTPPQSQTPPADGSGQQHIFLQQALNTQQQTRKTTRRTVITTALILGGVAAFGGIIALASQSSPQSQQPSPGASDPSQDQSWLDSANATAATIDQSPAIPLNGPIYWSADFSHAAITNLVQDQIELYKVQGQQLLHTIKNPENFSAPTIWWSPDNNKILACSDTGMIYAWGILNDQPLFAFTAVMAGYASPYPPSITSWSPDGNYCVISYRNENGNTTFTVLSAIGGKQILQTVLANSDGNAVCQVAWSPDSRYVALPDSSAWPGGTSWSASIWDRKTSQKVSSFRGVLAQDSAPQNLVLIAWSPNGDKVATIIDNTLWISQVSGGEAVKVLSNIYYTPSILSQIWSPDGKYLLLPNSVTLELYETSNWTENPQPSDILPSAFTIVAISWAADSKSINVADIKNGISNWPIS